MITMKPGKIEDPINAIRKIRNIENYAVLAGDYDLIVRARVDDVEDLHDMTKSLHEVPGLLKTTTSIVEKEITLKNN
jgi:DNA-binding Lrp family transcriptional regulator